MSWRSVNLRCTGQGGYGANVDALAWGGGFGRAADRRRAHGRLRVTAFGVLVVLGRPVGVDAAEHAGGLTDLDDVSVGIA